MRGEALFDYQPRERERVREREIVSDYDDPRESGRRWVEHSKTRRAVRLRGLAVHLMLPHAAVTSDQTSGHRAPSSSTNPVAAADATVADAVVVVDAATEMTSTEFCYRWQQNQ